MSSANSSFAVRDGGNAIKAFKVVDHSGKNEGPFNFYTSLINSKGEAISKDAPLYVADAGEAVDGVSMPNGGKGIVGWLSAVYEALISKITIKPSSVHMTQRVVNVDGNSVEIVAETTSRKYLGIMVLDPSVVTINFDGPAIPDAGWRIEGPMVAGGQGGNLIWEGSSVPANRMTAISTVPTRVVVIEGE